MVVDDDVIDCANGLGSEPPCEPGIGVVFVRGPVRSGDFIGPDT